MVMVTVTKNIDNYTIYYYQEKEYEAEILIYFANQNVGSIRFYDGQGAIPKPHASTSGGGFVYLNFPIERFGDIVSIFKYGKKVSIQVADQDSGVLRLFSISLT
jgi:hypothetical protein